MKEIIFLPFISGYILPYDVPGYDKSGRKIYVIPRGGDNGRTQSSWNGSPVRLKHGIGSKSDVPFEVSFPDSNAFPTGIIQAVQVVFF